MRLIRILLALAIVAVTAGAIWSYPVRQWQCNRDKRTGWAQVNRVFESGNEYERSVDGRNVIEMVNRWIQVFPADHELFMLRVAAEEVAGMRERALETYQHAFSLNERAEILVYIGLVQLEMGRADEAMANLERAVGFNVNMDRWLDPSTRMMLREKARERRERLQAAAAAAR